MNCQNKVVPGAKEIDDTWWSTTGNAVAISNKFLCAKSQFNGAYIVKTNNFNNFLLI